LESDKRSTQKLDDIHTNPVRTGSEEHQEYWK